MTPAARGGAAGGVFGGLAEVNGRARLSPSGPGVVERCGADLPLAEQVEEQVEAVAAGVDE